MNKNSKLYSSGALTSLALAMLATPSFAAPGQLDTSFGTSGIATVQVPGGVSAVAKVLEQPNGAILFATAAANQATTPVSSAEVGRLTAAGALDTSFGTNGLVAFTDAGQSVTQTDMQLQSNGSILVLGYVVQSSTTSARAPSQRHGVLARFTANGTLDTSFGSGGQVAITALGNASVQDTPSVLLLQSDGSILVADVPASSSASSAPIVLRLTTAGALDTSFGNNGSATISDSNFLVALAQQTDGSLMVVGDASPAVASQLQTNGTAGTDTTPGTLSVSSAQQDVLLGGNIAVTIQSNCSYVSLLPASSGSTSAFQLGRFTLSNTADTSFASPEISYSTAQSAISQPFALFQQSDGKTLAVGRLELPGGPHTYQQSFAIARVLSNGNLDTGFGTGGIVTTSFPSNAAAATAVTEQSDGNIVVGGVAALPNSGGEAVAIARYLSPTSTSSTTTATASRF
jgi:uncharacterized delta-60 repeat protein